MRINTLSRTALALTAAAVCGCAHENSADSSKAGTASSMQASAATTAPDAAASAKTFPNADAAADALADAARSQDPAALNAILGPGAGQLVYSGDPVADQNARQWFVQSYDAYHALTDNPDGSKTLEIGSDHWPMPIPIEQNKLTGQWSFDVAAGRDEVLNRRIGGNELACMQVCHAIVDAQQEYAMADPDRDGVPAYAERFTSHDGKKDGLYWAAKDGEPRSPLGALFATAADDGYSDTHAIGPRRPYHGYYYRMLKSQGPGAPGGARDYVIDGQMIGGFAVVAWPADYGNSGVMTFIVNQQGVVYQRNLGQQTDAIAKAMTRFDPAPPWMPAEPPTVPTTQSAPAAAK